MRLTKYIKGLFKYLFNPRISILSRVDSQSMISRTARIFRSSHIYNSSINEYSYVGVGSEVIYAEVGKFCSIGNNSICGMGIHTLNKLSTSPLFTESNNAVGYKWVNSDKSVYPYKKLRIGNDVWIGERVLIMGGLTIGDGAVIGAGAIVTKDVPPYAIVAGVPARIIRFRFCDEIIEKLLSLQWWNLDEDLLKNKIAVFQKDEVTSTDLNVLF